MKPKCIICDKELKADVFEGATPTIYFFECKSNKNHYFSFDFNLIDQNYHPKSFYCVNFNGTTLIFEIFITDSDRVICRIQDPIKLELTVDKTILEDIYSKFINNQLTIEHISFIINKLKDLALFI